MIPMSAVITSPSRKPPRSAPRMPTTISTRIPNPRPRITRPASAPAIAPIIIQPSQFTDEVTAPNTRNAIICLDLSYAGSSAFLNLDDPLHDALRRRPGRANARRALADEQGVPTIRQHAGDRDRHDT